MIKLRDLLTEKQFKGLDGIPANKSLEKISKAEKLNIIKAKGNIINFIVPDEYKGKRNFWQVISTGTIKKSSSGNIVMLMGGGPMNSPAFKTIDDLIDGVDWKSMEEKRRFNEGVTEAKEIKWQDVEVGDSANVTAINKTGVITKAYGRKFNLKFVNGTTKTYDASELTFVKSESITEMFVDENYADDFQTYLYKKYKGKSFNGWKLSLDSLAGTFEWNHQNKEEYILATPFWDGEEHLPVEITNEDGKQILFKKYPFKSTGDMNTDEMNYLKIMRQYLK
jgi:hypothetical protein